MSLTETDTPVAAADAAALTPPVRHDPVVASPASGKRPRKTLSSVTIRFAGDSGDGMQLAGTQFSDTSALAGNDISTLPDFPSEIRAPAGTIAGVSGYQIHFSSTDIFTPGDRCDVLVAMNPAALRVNLDNVKDGGIVLVNDDAFEPADLKKAGYAVSPLEDRSLSAYRVVRVPIDRLNDAATKESGLSSKDCARCKNMFALGLVYWLFDRSLETSLEYIGRKFAKKPAVALANAAALKAGYAYGDTAELFPEQYQVPRAQLESGTYRKVTGNEAAALGLVTAAKLAGKSLVYCSYPITPASEILQSLAGMKQMGVVTFQAEDEIAAMAGAVGASFAGMLGCTGTSGPGMALKQEAIGLAVITELPVVIVNVQRAGPSTGMPTKTEQADLLQAVVGRNGECPLPVIAAISPADCFDATLEASRVAVKYMTPVIVLSDGYMANGAEPWRVPDVSTLAPIVPNQPVMPDGGRFRPYDRDGNLSRPWVSPGTPGLEHRVGGLEKADGTGCVSHDPPNHERMCRIRAAKINGIKAEGRDLIWTGPKRGDLLVLGWGSTYGAIKAAVTELRRIGFSVSHCHVRYVHPLPEALGEAIHDFRQILIPEVNLGQLAMLIRAKYAVEPVQCNKVRGQPFTIQEITEAVKDVFRSEALRILD